MPNVTERESETVSISDQNPTPGPPREVVIDGVRYVAETGVPPPWFEDPEEVPSIGVAVTTFRRPKMLAQTLAEMESRLPEGAVRVVVDDGSPEPVTVPDGWELHRFEDNRGAPSAKNKCIELLYERGVEHFFLFDDDTFPTASDWWVPYVASPSPHLQYQFEDAPDHWPIREIRRDNQHRVFDFSRGPMLYFTRAVVDEIGGFHCAFGKRGGFHEDFSLRVHSAGLTDHPFMDVINPQLHCRDQNEKGITSTDHREHSIWRHVDRDRLPLYAEFREEPIPVLVPRRDDGGYRDQVWSWVKKNVWGHIDGFRVIEGYHVTGLFNRAAAVNTAAQIAGNWDVAVVADADAWVPEKQLREAVRRARATGQVTSALSEVWMLPESVSSTILRAKGVPANITRPQVRKTASGETQSICLAVPRAVFEAIGGFDDGYRGWGGEDNAFWHAATVAAGEPNRVNGPAYHLYHPPASTREERSADPVYRRNWSRWLRFKKLNTVAEIKRFR